MPNSESKRIVAKIEQYASDPASQSNNVKALSGSSSIRLRIADWQVIMDDRGSVLEILKIGPRGGIHDRARLVQQITTANGEMLVVLPLAEYERLVNASDIAAANRVRSAISEGRDELVPQAVVTRLLDGDSPVRVWRRHRGLSGRDLAAAVGLSAAYISEIETGKKEGSLAAFKKIAEALGLDLDELV